MGRSNINNGLSGWSWEMNANCLCLWICRYYEGGVSSVYFWDLDDGFAGVVLLKKSTFPP